MTSIDAAKVPPVGRTVAWEPRSLLSSPKHERRAQMARVKLITQKEDVDPKDYELFDALVTRRGRVSGPSTVVLYSPTLAGPWNEVSEFLQGASIVAPRQAELAVCTTARENDCGYIWGAHVPRARAASVPEAALDAVRSHRALEGLEP